MANLNKVMLIGRLTRDPEIRTFGSGGKVANFGFAVNNKRKNPSTGQWEDEPVFMEVALFNRGESGRQVDIVEQSLRKGSQIFIEGHLKFDQWTSQEGQKRTKLSVVVERFEFLEPRSDGGGEGGGRFARNPSSERRPPETGHHMGGEFEEPRHDAEPPDGRPDEDIPF